MARFLRDAGYAYSPQLFGWLEYLDAAGESTTLGILHRYVDSQGDGWSVATAYLERFFDRRKDFAAASGANDHEVFLQRARRLGERTAGVHRALAHASGNAAFDPEPTTARDVDAWTARARESAAKALEDLARDLDKVPEDLNAFALSLLERRREIEARLQLDPAVVEGVLKTRYHGDYHLGQVLVVADDFMLVDFEGEPGRSLEERRTKSSPLRDVAGMLRSINYAAVAALRGASTDRAEDTSRLAPLAADWERRSVDAFLEGYRAAIAGTPSVPSGARKMDALLELFVLEKAFYEISYELANRPSWVRIPLEGIRTILDRNTVHAR
jgi:maltose alpha-D-glucosyltransferase/alpha-amylase